MDLTTIFEAVLALVGFPALLAAAINLAKYFGMPDGLAPKVTFWSNVAVFVAVAVAAFLGRLDVVSQIDSVFGTLATLLLTILSFISSMGLTKVFHTGLRGTPYIGYSHTLSAK